MFLRTDTEEHNIGGLRGQPSADGDCGDPPGRSPTTTSIRRWIGWAHVGYRGRLTIGMSVMSRPSSGPTVWAFGVSAGGLEDFDGALRAGGSAEG